MKIYLDRVDVDCNDKKIATFEVDGEMIDFGEEQMPSGFANMLISNAIVECEVVNGCIINPVILYEETKKKEEEMKSRLHRLFKRSKK